MAGRHQSPSMCLRSPALLPRAVRRDASVAAMPSEREGVPGEPQVPRHVRLPTRRWATLLGEAVEIIRSCRKGLPPLPAPFPAEKSGTTPERDDDAATCSERGEGVRFRPVSATSDASTRARMGGTPRAAGAGEKK